MCTYVCYHKPIGQKGDRGDRGPSCPKGDPSKHIEIIHDRSSMHAYTYIVYNELLESHLFISGYQCVASYLLLVSCINNDFIGDPGS